jgi:hypothetical protein
MYANAMSGAGTNAVGIGVTLAAVSQQFTQGNITVTTDNPMDLAINGGGFFQVTDGANPALYTPQRSVQGRPRGLHRQQRRAPTGWLPGRRHRRDPARQRARAAPAHGRHRARRHHRRSSWR